MVVFPDYSCGTRKNCSHFFCSVHCFISWIYGGQRSTDYTVLYRYCTLHSVQCTAYSTVYSIYVQFTLNSTVHKVQTAQSTMYCIIHEHSTFFICIINCTLYSIRVIITTVYSFQCILYSAQCIHIEHIVRFLSTTNHCTSYIDLLCTLYSVQTIKLH